MPDRMKMKKASTIIVLSVVAVIAIAAMGGGLFLYHIKSSQNQCDDYANQRFGAHDENLIKRDGAYLQCMTDKGLRDYARYYHL